MAAIYCYYIVLCKLEIHVSTVSLEKLRPRLGRSIEKSKSSATRVLLHSATLKHELLEKQNIHSR